MITKIDVKFKVLEICYKLFTLQKVYNDIVLSLNLFSIECPACSKKGHMIWHGSYERSLRTEKGLEKLIIQRVKCKDCGTTHAILPSCIVPYSRTPLRVQLLLILCGRYHRKDILNKLSILYDIGKDYIYYLIEKFNKTWYQKLISIECKISSPKLIFECFKHYRTIIMQIKPTPHNAHMGNHIRDYDLRLNKA